MRITDTGCDQKMDWPLEKKIPVGRYEEMAPAL
jgi:hypothetical protein